MTRRVFGSDYRAVLWKLTSGKPPTTLPADNLDDPEVYLLAKGLADPSTSHSGHSRRGLCERCGKERMISETHMPQGDMLIRDILDHARHDGCGGRAGRAELLTGIEGSSRPVRRIVLQG